MTDFDDALCVTVGELRAAVARICIEQFEVTENEGEIFGEDVVRDIMAHREREWQTGDVVRSEGGIIWMRTSGGRWSRMGKSGIYSHECPQRPLTLIHSPYDEAEAKRRIRALERARDDGAPI